MAVEQRDIRVVEGRTNGRFGQVDEPPLKELFRQLGEDASTLVRQEVELGKAELRDTAKSLGKDASRLGIAAVIGLLGAMAGTAFAIIGLGALIDNYWLSALIVTVVLLGVAATTAKSAIDRMKEQDLKPTQTIETLRADAAWAKREVDAVKTELKSDGSRSTVQM